MSNPVFVASLQSCREALLAERAKVDAVLSSLEALLALYAPAAAAPERSTPPPRPRQQPPATARATVAAPAGKSCREPSVKELRRELRDLVPSLGRWVTSAEVAEMVAVKPSSVSTVLAGLAEGGHVARRPVPPDQQTGHGRYQYGGLALLDGRAAAGSQPTREIP